MMQQKVIVMTLDKRFNHIWFPFTCSQDAADYPPVIIERGQGLYLYDQSGKAYLDAVGSWWVSIFGHNHLRITGAIKAQLDQLEHVLMAGFIAEPTLRLTELLTAMVPPALSRIFYSDNGSTAVEVALKTALQYWANQGNARRSEFVSLSGGYHGDTLGAMSVGGIPGYHALFHERFKKQHFVNAPYCYRCPVGRLKETCNAECMDSLQEFCATQGDRLAACIFEPMVQGAAGMRVYPAKALERLFNICASYGVLTIADEVAMGFGRTGKLFACEHAQRVPDIMCVAKGLTGGYLPMAATLVQERIYQEFCGDFMSERTFTHGHTFTGNPLAAAAACETLTLIKENNIPSSLAETAAFFRTRLEEFNEFDIVGDVRSIGMVGALELVADKRTKNKLSPEKRTAFHICRQALRHGVLIRPLGDVIYFIPAYTITTTEIETMFLAVKQAIKETLYE
ncbi:MAG: adenosylmethionine--8-amino-7-oxononanoate transaminase [Chitinivibrionales bacterium]|nr:adenosylmethionine--8-amino-7-oxononanoate transaminase [Chitinivibrionales bacterium]